VLLPIQQRDIVQHERLWPWIILKLAIILQISPNMVWMPSLGACSGQHLHFWVSAVAHALVVEPSALSNVLCSFARYVAKKNTLEEPLELMAAADLRPTGF